MPAGHVSDEWRRNNNSNNNGQTDPTKKETRKWKITGPKHLPTHLVSCNSNAVDGLHLYGSFHIYTCYSMHGCVCRLCIRKPRDNSSSGSIRPPVPKPHGLCIHHTCTHNLHYSLFFRLGLPFVSFMPHSYNKLHWVYIIYILMIIILMWKYFMYKYEYRVYILVCAVVYWSHARPANNHGLTRRCSSVIHWQRS